MRSSPATRFALVGFTLACVLRAAAKGLAQYECLEHFSKNQSKDFAGCVTKPCFIFVSEEPFIRLDSATRTPNHRKPFPCNKAHWQTPLLGGSVFNVMALTSAGDGALCVWGGPKCRFNKMVKFIDKAATEAPEYQFGAIGLLSEIKERLTANVAQSVSLAQEELAIFGPDPDIRDSFPFQRLVRPFRLLTWAAFAFFFAAIVIGGWCTACAFGSCSLSLRRAFHFFMDPREAVVGSAPLLTMQESLDHSPSECVRIYERRRLDRIGLFHVAKILLRLALTAMLIIFLLFYELAVVNFLFIERSRPKVQDVGNLTVDDLRRYAVEEEAATEKLWLNAVYKPGKFDQRRPPWRRCAHLEKCFDWALDEKNEVTYVVGFKSAGIFQVLKRNACKRVTHYETSRNMYTFGAGWLYGRKINETFRRTIDTELLEMHERGQLPELLKADTRIPPGTCSQLIPDIDIGVIGVSVLVLVLPPLLLVLLMAIYFCFKIQSATDGHFLKKFLQKYSRSDDTNEQPKSGLTAPKTDTHEVFSTGSTWNTASDHQQQYAVRPTA